MHHWQHYQRINSHVKFKLPQFYLWRKKLEKQTKKPKNRHERARCSTSWQSHTPWIRNITHAYTATSKMLANSSRMRRINGIKLKTEMNREMHCNGLVVSPASTRWNCFHCVRFYVCPLSKCMNFKLNKYLNDFSNVQVQYDVLININTSSGS